MNLILDIKGFTNNNVVRCIYDKSPLEFYAQIKNDSVLDRQIDILSFAWPNLTKYIFLKDVCSSSLEKRVWINRQELIPVHDLKLFIPKINLDELNTVLKNSIMINSFSTITEIEDFFNNKVIYPTATIDFIPLILKKCDPYVAGLKNNILYFLLKPPIFK